MEIEKILERFGLGEKEREVWLTLSKNEWMTVLQLARRCKVKRSSIYRVLEGLVDKGLVEMKLGDKRVVFRVTNLSGFVAIVKSEEDRLVEMKENLAELESRLVAGLEKETGLTEVSFYKGEKGISALEWKIANNKNTEVLIFGVGKWDKVVGKSYAEEVRGKYVKNNLMIKEIMNVDDKEKWTENDEYVKKHYQLGVIERKILPIDNELLVVNDTIYLYSIGEKEIVGIEIKNKGYTGMMRRLFEMVWEKARVCPQ